MAALILTCFIISMGGTGNHERIGFRYWSNPGAFAPYLLTGNKGYFLGWWANMTQACFAYTGTEVVCIAFGEVPNPKKNIPHAVKQTFWRIAFFYILGVLVLGMAVPYSSPALVSANGASTSAGEFINSITLNIENSLLIQSSMKLHHPLLLLYL
jgi:yeast amino acid transporter